MDKRKNNGGHSTKGKAGRKPKCDEQKLVEKLSPFEKDALRVLHQAVKGGEKWAVELYMKYYYGLPKQVIDQTINTDDNQIEIKIIKPNAKTDTSDS